MGNKIIDESRQGEALLLSVDKNIVGRQVFIESYGCAMNFSDSEIVASILIEKGYSTTSDYKSADLILVNTCAIRENAEQRVRNRLKEFNVVKRHNPKLMVGVMGCMAERLKTQFLEQEKIVDIVVGPDAYRELPNLIETVEGGQKAVNVLLSREETYADISPVRLDSNGVTAFISIMRGCDNMCSFCVVPFTRGRERSRDPESIVAEAKLLFEQGYREVTLLGQNVDSYKFKVSGSQNEGSKFKVQSSKLESDDKKTETLNLEPGTLNSEPGTISFAQLLEMVAKVSPDLRIRFSTSHPKDMTDDVLHTMAKYDNICKYIHLPIQSGNSRVLEMMNRGYTREWYLERIAAIRRIIPECGISTDIMAGFCSETEEEHQDTLALMEEVKYDFAYMFAYSERPKTQAERKFEDDISEEVKQRRLAEIVALQQKHSAERTKLGVGKVHRVLVERVSKKSEEQLSGRNSQNSVVVFNKHNFKRGDYVNVLAESCTVATLIGKAV
ncbi:MAG: tRNA (N6-isopentenyl adenosine(37)-C2)-methylthiotransferase MiaB [Bacteroidetes bacterium]|nr:tRNA (N6-isopentenyl adenosine(37)-C2)-methylthiotransferase MiaB [Bacteroidota bacterium]